MKAKLFWQMSRWLLCLVPYVLSGQSTLTVGDPRSGFNTQKGNIEDALLTVQNKGLYLEYGLYLGFSARGTSYKETDSLEVVFNFNLPEKSIVTDSWLWIGEDICKAKILDTWTASNIYEDIVKRRRDPSLLTKTGTNSYALRIFPMGGKEIRRVKISYLTPLSWKEDKVTALLPAPLLNASRFIPQDFPVLFWEHPEFKDPNVENTLTGPFLSGVDSIQGPYNIFTLVPNGNYGNANLRFSNPMKNGLFFCSFEDRDESYYQLALKPSAFTDKVRNEKYLVLVDYHYQDPSITKAGYLDQVKKELKSFLTSSDSFEVLFSNLNYPSPPPAMRSGSDEQLDVAFWNAEEKLLSYTNLPQLLEKGLRFASEQAEPVNVLLVSLSNQFGSNLVANDILKNALSLNSNGSPVYVLDFCPRVQTYQINGRTYFNNEYLYINLAQVTGGVFIREPNPQLYSNAWSAMLGLTLEQFTGFDLHLKVAQGITYGKQILISDPESFSARNIYTQTGAFRGGFPFTAEMSGEVDRNLFQVQFDIGKNETIVLDSSAKTVWHANVLFKQEEKSPNNSIIWDIVYKSINHRILTRYTAFLCLEDSSYYCSSCYDETGIPTANEEESLDSLTKLLAYPNPFHDRITIELHSGDVFKNVSAPARIMDLQGRVIRHIQLDHAFKSGITQYIWDGTDDRGSAVPSGAYVLEIRIGDKTLYEKLMRF